MNITIIGVGLMGGSLGLALKQSGLCRRVVGLVRRPEAALQAVQLGIVDEATQEPAAALAEADIAVFSTPIRIILRQLPAYAKLFKPGAIITDMGSTKQAITQEMARLPDGLQPLGCHPMCGKEVAGMSAAEAALFRDAPWILTPLPRTDSAAVETVRAMAQAIGARTMTLDAARHDTLVAAISHLPYAMSAALVLAAQGVAQNDPTVWDVAAGGFRDTSRVAASDETMMMDILLTNRAAVGALIAGAQKQLDAFAKAIAAGDEATLRRLMSQAAKQRRELYQ